jgi:DNA-binding NtrC family response regulator
MSGTILIVDDDAAFAEYLVRVLRSEGYMVQVTGSGAEARASIGRLSPEVVLLDLMLPDADGGELLGQLRQLSPDSAFIIVTGHGSIRSAVRSTRAGAQDYLTKPFEPEEMLLAIGAALREQRQAEEVRLWRAKVHAGPAEPAHYVSPGMRRAMQDARRAATQEGIALLLGESGTGKKHTARWIHANSARAEGPFFAVNCGVAAREHVAAALFGREPSEQDSGRKRGLLELADRGTVLLEHVADLDPALQDKLLGFLETRTFSRMGGERSVCSDARVLAACLRDPSEEVARGTLRRELYWRLSVLPIQLPPLRQRIDDIPVLAGELLAALAREHGLGECPRLDPEAVRALQSCAWTGNLPELRNVLERALLVRTGDALRAHDLQLDSQGGRWSMLVEFRGGQSLHEVTREVARALVREALRRAKGKQEAATLLGMSRHALAYQMRTLGIDEDGSAEGQTTGRVRH